jgi:pimeloyl-ACP methyl ester carboxylesterase
VDPTGLTILGLAFIVMTGLVTLAARIVRRIERQHPPSAEFVQIDEVKLHVRVTGDTSKPAILVLHGAASNLEEPYSALAERFEDQHVIWLDRPGMGWSERPTGAWTPQSEAELITRLLDHLRIDNACVIGHSWGAAISMALAVHHPERVRGLILIGPALSAWIGTAAWFNHATFWPVLGPIMTRLIVPLIGEVQLRVGARNAFHPEPVPEHYDTRGRLPLLLRGSVWRANAADMRDVNHHLEILETKYADIAQPTIMLAGKADTVVWTHRHAGMVSRRMANAQLRLIPDAGHNLHHHHPDAILDAVLEIDSKLPISVETEQATA